VFLQQFTPAQLIGNREPFDSDEFLYELKMDGFRALACCGSGKTACMVNRGLRSAIRVIRSSKADESFSRSTAPLGPERRTALLSRRMGSPGLFVRSVANRACYQVLSVASERRLHGAVSHRVGSGR
jgi:hypothetical protein